MSTRLSPLGQSLIKDILLALTSNRPLVRLAGSPGGLSSRTETL